MKVRRNKVNNIRFSIVCPVYNAEKFLPRAINSLLTQSYSNWELILIDDGSTDDSSQLCDSYSKSDKRINVIHQTNQGQSKARLVGIGMCSGDYILFLDSDDYFDITALESLTNELSENSSDLVLFDAKKNCDGKFANVYSLESKEFITDKKEILFECFGKRTAGYFWTYCFKKETLRISIEIKKKFSEVKYSEDVYLIYQVIKHNVNSLLILPEPLYVYVVNEESITHNQTVAKVKDRFSVFDDVYKDLCKSQNIKVNKKIRPNIGWTYLSFLNRAAKEYDFERFKETVKEIRSSYIFKHLSRFKKDKYNSLIQFLLIIRMYKRVYTIIRKH